MFSGFDEVGCDFQPLGFAAGECACRLSHEEVAEIEVDEGLESLSDFGVLVEEVDGFGDVHLEDVVDVFIAVAHIEYFAFEAFAATGFADEAHVGHKLHVDGDLAFALALFAAAAFGVEGEVFCL